MPDLAPSSPLSYLRRGGAAAEFALEGLALREEPNLRVVLLFDKPDDPTFRQQVWRDFGVEPLTEPNIVAIGASAVAWIAPGQWLVIGAGVITDNGIDVSDAYCGIGLTGMRSVELLSKSVPIELDATSFAPNHCARTLMGSIPIFLMACDEGNFLILVERGLAHAAWAWLVDGAASFSR